MSEQFKFPPLLAPAYQLEPYPQSYFTTCLNKFHEPHPTIPTNTILSRIASVTLVFICLIIISFNIWQLKPPTTYHSNTVRSKSESAVILIAGSVAINGSNISTRKPMDSHRYTTSDLHGTVSDIANMYKLFLQSKGADVIRVFTDVAAETKTRSKVLRSIKDLLNDNDRTRFIIYYSGHGKVNGDWVFDNETKQLEFISLNDILFLWNNRIRNEYYKQDLIIISDSCHSGNWVNKLKVLKPIDVWMQAAARAHQYSFDDIDGGVFTSKYVDSACRWIPTDHDFNVLCYISGIAVASLGSILGIIKDKVIGYAYHCISKAFQPTYYAPRYHPYYFDRIYLGVTMDNKYHLHCYFFNDWDDLDFIRTVNYSARIGSFGKMGTVMLFDVATFMCYMCLLILMVFIFRIGCKRGICNIKLLDIFAVYTVVFCYEIIFSLTC